MTRGSLTWTKRKFLRGFALARMAKLLELSEGKLIQSEGLSCYHQRMASSSLSGEQGPKSSLLGRSEVQ